MISMKSIYLEVFHYVTMDVENIKWNILKVRQFNNSDRNNEEELWTD